MSIFIHEITCFINSDKLLEKKNINRKKALKIVKGLEVNAVEFRKKNYFSSSGFSSKVAKSSSENCH
tara:strand:+ start:789 stop:989 length:201 start_codon:yes stop_codon:yes gene_type:complete